MMERGCNLNRNSEEMARHGTQACWYFILGFRGCREQQTRTHKWLRMGGFYKPLCRLCVG